MLTKAIIEYWGGIARATDHMVWSRDQRFRHALFSRHPALARKKRP